METKTDGTFCECGERWRVNKLRAINATRKVKLTRICHKGHEFVEILD